MSRCERHYTWRKVQYVLLAVINLFKMAEDPHVEYIEKWLTPVVEDMITEVLLNKPEDPIEFMINWLQNKKGSASDSAFSPQSAMQVINSATEETPRADAASSGTESHSDDDEYIDELPLPIPSRSGPRPSVSAEAFGAWNKKTEFVARFFEKTLQQTEAIVDKLSCSFMFSALGDSDRDIVVNAMDERRFAAGEDVIKQGEDGSELFVVDSGELECYKVFKEGDPPTYLKTYYAGEAFGELALLYSAPRAATITAKTECLLWVLDRETFNHIVKDASAKKRAFYESFLSRVDLLANMDPYERSKIADAFKEAKFSAGEYVIREGEQGDTFYFLEVGDAEATKTLNPGQPPNVVKEYSLGDYFGELALLRGEPRAANIVAKTDLKCVTLDRHSFKRMLGPLDEILQRNASKYSNILSK